MCGFAHIWPSQSPHPSTATYTKVIPVSFMTTQLGPKKQNELKPILDVFCCVCVFISVEDGILLCSLGWVKFAILQSLHSQVLKL